MSRAETELTVALARDMVGAKLRGGKAPEYASSRRLSKPRLLYAFKASGGRLLLETVFSDQLNPMNCAILFALFDGIVFSSWHVIIYTFIKPTKNAFDF